MGLTHLSAALYPQLPQSDLDNSRRLALFGEVWKELYPQGGGNALHNSNVAVTALHVRHYPFPAFQGQHRTSGWNRIGGQVVYGDNDREAHV